MKKEKNILVAFILNLSFSVFELIGSFFTGSVAILSDSVHDLGDAVSIGLSYFLERKSHEEPDEKYTYGYGRYSLLGGFITTCVLLFGSAGVIFNAVLRILNPKEINYDGMLIFAVIGVAVNFAAAFFTRGGESTNERAVNLHMLEDVLGWAAVLFGAVVMKFTDFAFIDPLMSIGIAVFILINAFKNLKQIGEIFLEKTPDGIDLIELKRRLCTVGGVVSVHHIHVRSLDTGVYCAEMHIVADGDDIAEIKKNVRHVLGDFEIFHATIELEGVGEECYGEDCKIIHKHPQSTHRHHHH